MFPEETEENGYGVCRRSKEYVIIDLEERIPKRRKWLGRLNAMKGEDKNRKALVDWAVRKSSPVSDEGKGLAALDVNFLAES